MTTSDNARSVAELAKDRDEWMECSRDWRSRAERSEKVESVYRTALRTISLQRCGYEKHGAKPCPSPEGAHCDRCLAVNALAEAAEVRAEVVTDGSTAGPREADRVRIEGLERSLATHKRELTLTTAQLVTEREAARARAEVLEAQLAVHSARCDKVEATHARLEKAVVDFDRLLAGSLPCGHTIGDLVGGALAITKCGACVKARQDAREASPPIPVPRVKEAALARGVQVYSLPWPARHDAVIQHMARLGVSAIGADQGFVLDDGRFVSRQVARLVAVAAGQVKNDGLIGSVLTSEDLW